MSSIYSQELKVEILLKTKHIWVIDYYPDVQDLTKQLQDINDYDDKQDKGNPLVDVLWN